jgi:hypothetical protein
VVNRLVDNADGSFMSELHWRELCRACDTKRSNTTVQHTHKTHQTLLCFAPRNPNTLEMATRTPSSNHTQMATHTNETRLLWQPHQEGNTNPNNTPTNRTVNATRYQPRTHKCDGKRPCRCQQQAKQARTAQQVVVVSVRCVVHKNAANMSCALEQADLG